MGRTRSAVHAELLAVCHPDQRAARIKGRLCVDCLAEERARTRQIRRVDLGAPPVRIPWLRHYALTTAPDRCPKCRGLVMVQGRRVWCVNCGGDFYLVMG